MVNKTLPYEKRAKNKTDYTILIFLIDSNAQFLMKCFQNEQIMHLVLQASTKTNVFSMFVQLLLYNDVKRFIYQTKVFSVFFFCILKTKTFKKVNAP